MLRSIICATLMLCFSAAFAQTRELPSPAAAGSGQPNLSTAPDGRVYLSWLERLEGRFALRFAIKEKNGGEKSGWSAPRTIAEGANWLVNWADFPSLIVLPDGSLAAHWLAKSSSGKFSYDVMIARSFDGGKTWTQPLTPHRDGTPTEHGFVSLFPAPDGALAAVWLDGREMKGDDSHSGDHGNMTLRYATIRRDGSLADEAAIDAKVCECCQTSAALTSAGPVVVYRDRSDEEVRDISIVRLRRGKWSAPQTIHRDNWRINGCPVNGPAVAAAGKQVAVAWFTAVNNAPRVQLAFSQDAGESFGAPVTIDDGNPAGRVDVLLLRDGSALVCWLEKLPEGGAVRVRRVRPDGSKAPALTVAPSGTARSNGFPQMARAAGSVIFAWTGERVLTAELPVSDH